MEEERTESIFGDRRKPRLVTEAGASIANIFGNRRLSRTEQQGRDISATAKQPIGDPNRLAKELIEKARQVGIEPRELGEE